MPKNRRCALRRPSGDDLQAGLRTVPFEKSAVIAYRIGETVDITNIFYGGRNYEALYKDAPEEE